MITFVGITFRNVVKAFYTAGFLMDVLTTFGELTDEVQQNCKYAKWKAAYIHNCLRNGEMPVPGPLGGKEEGSDSGPSTSGIGNKLLAEFLNIELYLTSFYLLKKVLFYSSGFIEM